MKIQNFIQKSLVSSLYRVQLAFASQVEAVISKLGVGYIEALILAALFFEEEKESISPGKLVKVLGVKKARISQALTKLMKEGFIKREIQKGDSRKFIILLQPSGSKKALQIIKAFDALENKMEANIGPSKHALLQRDLVKLSQILRGNDL